MLGSASLSELERMWKVSCWEPPFLLLKEPDGTAGSVDGLEVGLGSLVGDHMPRGRIIQAGCCGFQSETPTLSFPSEAGLVFQSVFPVDTGHDQYKILLRCKVFCTRFHYGNAGEMTIAELALSPGSLRSRRVL